DREGGDAESRGDGRARFGADLDDRQRIRRLAARDQSPDQRPRHVPATDERDIQWLTPAIPARSRPPVAGSKLDWHAPRLTRVAPTARSPHSSTSAPGATAA